MARHRPARFVATMVAALAVSGSLMTAEAQQRGTLNPSAPRLLVVNFRSPEKAAGVAIADAIRDRMMREYTLREARVITRKDIDRQLQASGYPPDEALSQNDASALAKGFGAEDYVEGVITPVNGQYRVNARLVLARNPALVQPLPVQVVAKPTDAANGIVKAVDAARKQLDDEKKCYTTAATGNEAEALAAAQKGVQEYGQATLARLCALNILVRQKVAPDSIVKVSDEILAIDPRSRLPLQYKWQALKDLGQDSVARNILLDWLAADPSNTQLQTAVVNELAQSKDFQRADSVITAALDENESDIDLLRVGFLVYNATEQWQKALHTGEQLAQIDTALDRNYFLRMANAYVETQQPQKASEVIARGIQKLPNDPQILVGAASIYREAGQLQQAIETLRRGLQVNPRAPQANLALAQIYVDMNQPDSAVTALQAAQAAGDSASLVGGVAASVAQKALETGQASQSLDDYLRAIKFSQLAFQLDPTQKPYQFILGAAAFQAAALELQVAQKSSSCEMARAAGEHLTLAQASIGPSGSVNPTSAAQIMTAATEYAKYPPQMVKQYCK